MGWIAEIGRFISVSIFLIFAASLLIAGIHLRKKGRYILPLFALASLLTAWYPFWGYFPGQLLAKQLCSNIGGVRQYNQPHIIAKSILYSFPASLDASTISELLVRNGFESVEERFPPNSSTSLATQWKRGEHRSGAILAYKISDINSQKCDSFREAIKEDFGLAIGAYQHGVRHDQCISIERRNASNSQVDYKIRTSRKWFPIRTDISHTGFYLSNTNKAFIESNSFYYYADDPYRGRVPRVDCDSAPPNILKLPTALVTSQTSAQRDEPSHQPEIEEKQLNMAHVSLQDLGLDRYLNISTVSEMRRKILGFDMMEAHIWLATPDSTEKRDLLVLTNHEEIPIRIPPHKITNENRQTSPIIHALLRNGNDYIIIRGDPRGYSWEIITYSPSTRSILRESLSPHKMLSTPTPTPTPKQYLTNNNIFLTEVSIKNNSFILVGYIASLSNTSSTRVFGKFKFVIPR